MKKKVVVQWYFGELKNLKERMTRTKTFSVIEAMMHQARRFTEMVLMNQAFLYRQHFSNINFEKDRSLDVELLGEKFVFI